MGDQLLKLNRDQLRWLVGLFTGYSHLKGHLFKLGLTDDPICERRLEEDESATRVLCDSEAIAHLWFRHLGQIVMETGDYYDAPISKVLAVHSKQTIDKWLIQRGSTIDQFWSRCRGRMWPATPDIHG
jgi:hypothetical protein